MSRSWTTFVKKNSWNSLQDKPAILSDAQISFSEIINKPTTLSGYGITNAQPLGNELTAIQALADTVGFLRKTGDGSYFVDSTNYLPLTSSTLPFSLTIDSKTAHNNSIEIGSTGGFSTTPYIDFHSGIVPCDYDSRIIASGGNGSNTGGTLSYVAASHVFYGMIRIPQSSTISSSTATGNTGTICWDSNYIYVCTATNTWKRAALSSW